MVVNISEAKLGEWIGRYNELCRTKTQPPHKWVEDFQRLSLLTAEILEYLGCKKVPV